MAKFVNVGYGSDGRGVGKTQNGYTYIVNDNVRKGDKLQPVATSSRGRKFVTTGVVNETHKENSVKGREISAEVQKTLNAKESNVANKEITEILTAKDVGVRNTAKNQEQLRYMNLANQIGKTPFAELTKNAQQTYDEYAKKFINKENKN